MTKDDLNLPPVTRVRWLDDRLYKCIVTIETLQYVAELQKQATSEAFSEFLNRDIALSQDYKFWEKKTGKLVEDTVLHCQLFDIVQNEHARRRARDLENMRLERLAYFEKL